MAELTANVVAQACENGAAEAAEALQRALDLDSVSIQVGEAGQVATNALPEGFDAAGLAVVLTTGKEAAIFALAESSGLVPEWTGAPDPTEQSKLTTLAQELGMILLPEELMPDDFQAARVKNLKGGLARGGVADEAVLVPLEISSGATKATAALIFPATKPAAVIGAASGDPPAAAKPSPKPKAVESPKPPPTPTARLPRQQPRRGPTRVEELPKYSRSLLRIQVPVVVTLAEKRQPLNEIMELGPGAIIQFEKSCEEMLQLNVGDQAVATGEAVKVGDKFGLRINAITMPEERFENLGSR